VNWPQAAEEPEVRVTEAETKAEEEASTEAPAQEIAEESKSG
jgi:hypothetical protein